MNAPLPHIVHASRQRADEAGFSMSCDPATGRLLAVLAASVPSGGRILELGTGAGLGTAWIVHGLTGRSDVELVTVELDAMTAAVAARGNWPEWVELIVGDALDVLRGQGRFDLIFADAQGGKWDGLPLTVSALRPAGHLLVDDMTPAEFADANHQQKTHEVRTYLLRHPDLISVEIGWSTGLILSTRLLVAAGWPYNTHDGP